MSSTLLRSQVECPNCGDIITSVHRHDFQPCSCGQTMIDGGRSYMRVIGDAIVSAGIEDYDRSLFINGALTNAEAALALTVYKMLWQLSDGGKNPVTTDEVQQGLGKPLLSHALVRRYLIMFSVDDQSPVIKVNHNQWLPKVPLAVRDDV